MKQNIQSTEARRSTSEEMRLRGELTPDETDKGEQCVYCGELQDCEAQRDELLLAAKALIEALPPKGDRNKRYSPQCDAVEAAIAKVEGGK